LTVRAPKRPGQPGGTGMTLCCSGRPLKLSNTARALYPRSDVCYSPSAALIYRCPHLPLPSSAAALICRCPHLPLPSSAAALIRGGAKPLSSLYTNSKYVETWLFCSSARLLYARSSLLQAREHMQRTRGTSRAHPSAGSSRGSSSTDAVTAVARPLALHPTLGFKKHGNGIHPPICFLFKCVS
jgi:hypothetical protein